MTLLGFSIFEMPNLSNSVNSSNILSKMKPPQRISGIKPLEGAICQTLIRRIMESRDLDTSVGKKPEGFDSMFHGYLQMEVDGRQLYFVGLGHPAHEWHLAICEFKIQEETSPLWLDVLEFLVYQLQSECRWLTRMDHTQSMLYLDDLTGLYNYRYLDLAIDSELRRAQRFHTSFCLLFIDLDNFKEINDTYGHLSGSDVLRQVGGILKGALREVDCVIRYGGDEYVAVLLGSQSPSGVLAAERIRKEIEETPFEVEGGEARLTVSIGVAAYPEHGRSKKELLKRADETMYQSKKAGKNRVTILQENTLS